MAQHTVSILKVETYFMHVVQCVLQKAHGVALPAVNSEQSPGPVIWGVDTMCIALSLTVNASLVPGDAAFFEPHSVSSIVDVPGRGFLQDPGLCPGI
jgi:hypothetical protein